MPDDQVVEESISSQILSKALASVGAPGQFSPQMVDGLMRLAREGQLRNQDEVLRLLKLENEAGADEAH